MAYREQGYVLVHTATGEPVNEGDVVHSFRGERAVVTSAQFPQSPNSSGRVYVREAGCSGQAGYYPSVYGLRWVEESDAL